MIIYLLNKKQKAIKAISTKKMVEAKYTEGINQASKLTLSVPLKNRLPSNAFFALFKKIDSADYLLFKLNDETIENDRISYTGVDAAYDELKAYSYVQDIRPVKSTAKEILKRVLENTRWEVGYIDSTNPIDTNFYYQPVLECIQKVVQLFRMELVFTYGFDSRKQVITSRKVNLYQQQGQRTGKRFEYGSNLLTVTREEDSQDIVTALVGRGKGEEKTDEETGEATGGYGRRITFKDVVWSKLNGDPADKPAGQEFVEDVEATKVFGYDDGHPRIGLVTFEDIEDPVELLNATWASLVSSCRPKVSFKANVTDVGNLGLGDTIAIIRHELGIEYFTRVFKVTHNLLDKQQNTVEMGDDMSDRSLTSYISNIDSIAQNAVQTATSAAVQAGSKNKNYYSTTKPPIADEGDNLFLNLGNGEFEYWVWHNHQWEFVQSTQDLKNVEQSMQQAQQDLSKTKAEIQQNQEYAEKALTTINQTITGLKVKVDSGVSQSQFQTLSNQIDLKVSKGDVLGQINLEAGSTLIKNNKIFLDADSVVFGGKAFIPSAAITDIAADKITSGTLDAGKINVININAANIVSGTITGANSTWNLTTGRLSLGDENVRLDLQDGQIGMTSNDETGDYFFQLKKEYVYRQDDESRWINLPVLALENKWGIGLITEVPKDHWSWGDLASNYSEQTHPGILIRDVMQLYDWGPDLTTNPVVEFVPTDPGIILQGGRTGVKIIGGDSFATYFGDTRLDIVPNIFVGYTNMGSWKKGQYVPHTGIFIQAAQIQLMPGTDGCLVTGNLGVTGNKNSVVPTSNGMTAINAYETAEYYFGDLGKAKTDDNGQILIQIDPLFLETVNTSIPYHVFVSPYGNANVWVEQIDRNSFLVKSSKPNIEFSWEIKAKRLGYEKNRLEVTQKEVPKELIQGYKEKGIL